MISNLAYTIIVLVIALAIVVCSSTYLFAWKLIQPHLKMITEATNLLREANLDKEETRAEMRTYMQLTKEAEQKVLGLTEVIADNRLKHEEEIANLKQQYAELNARYEEVKDMLTTRRRK